MKKNKSMKIILLITVIVCIIISCRAKSALTSNESDESNESEETLIDVLYADEAFLKKYKMYDSFIQQEDYAHIIALIPNVPVKDFSWLAVGVSDWSDEGDVIYDIDEELYSLKELHPQKPLVVSWVEVGMMSVFGFSYLAEDGQKKYFMGGVGNYGEDPEEYDGPAFWTAQFFPKTVLSGQYYKIHKDVPDLLFRGMGYKDKDDETFFKELVIVNSETKEVINKINLLDYTLDGDPPASGDALEIEFIDVNFDGFKDITIFDCPSGNWNLHYLYFVWDKSQNRYVPDTQGLSDLGLPQFDEEKQLVSSMDRSSAVDHWFYTRKYINGILTVIEEISENAVWFDDDELLASIVPKLSEYPSYTFMHHVTKKLNYTTSQLEIVESKYQLYVPNDWTLIDEYDANSDTGRQLEQLFYGQQTNGE